MFDPQLFQGSATGPRAILRLLQVLECLAEHPEGRTLSQICAALEVPKTTLFTMLKVLQASGHTQQAAGIYRLGGPAVKLGAQMAASGRRTFPGCADGTLQSLCRCTGETGFLAVLTADGADCRYVSVVETDSSLRFTVKVDSLKPSYATGTGQAMLAYLPDAELRAILERVTFERITDKTVRSRAALLKKLDAVRRCGTSTTDSGTVAGVLSVAAPIFDHAGRVVAAISVGGPSARMAGPIERIEREVRGAAEDISAILGYAGEGPCAAR